MHWDLGISHPGVDTKKGGPGDDMPSVDTIAETTSGRRVHTRRNVHMVRRPADSIPFGVQGFEEKALSSHVAMYHAGMQGFFLVHNHSVGD